MEFFPNTLCPLLVIFTACCYPALGQAEQNSSLADTLYDNYGVELAGFAETRAGLRLTSTELEKDTSLAEARLQLELTHDFDTFIIKFKGDLLGDAVLNKLDTDLRDLSILFSPTENIDVKLGRMVSTWGTGDLLFINDVFPKDWQSFFIGRDDEYLKQASNIIKTSIFAGDYALDIVYTPLFQGSESVTGERLSYYHPMVGRLVGRDMIINETSRDSYFTDAEIAGRLSRQFGGVEVSLYGYSGFWQEMEGFDPVTFRGTYPRLNVWGASARAPMLGGIGNIESGYYDSVQDEDGKNPFVRPSEYRFLVGFERELGHELTGGVQYYLEKIDNYTNYKNSLPSGMHSRDEYRNMFTMRLTQLLMDQNLTLSLFVYYSPTENDGYARPQIRYKLTDNWQVNGGANLFWGEDDYTFWGRFTENNNGYIGLRYSF
jgi:hypothetical protein